MESNSSSTPIGPQMLSPMESPLTSPRKSPTDSHTGFPIEVEDDEVKTDISNKDVSLSSTKRRLTSEVWNHFKKIKVDGFEKAECNYCHKRLGGKPSDGTNHLQHHTTICRLKPQNNIRQKTFVEQQRKADGKMCVSNYTFDQECSRRELARMIAMHEYPISIVEHFGFKSYSASLQPLFKIPSRNTIRSDIMKLYESEKAKIMELLEKNSSRVAITTNMWTTSNQKNGFMAITAHFIDNNWDLQSIIIRFVYVLTPHTAAVLSDELLNCLFDWNLDRKLSTLTVDNCSTNDAVIDMLMVKLNPSYLLLDGKLFHMRCCAHILNLIVQDGLRIMGDGIERVRDSVAFWVATPKREQTFRENARHLHIDSSRKLVLDCKTRWNSTYLMLNVALIYKDVFDHLLQREPLYKIKITKEDWVLAKELCEKLEVFYNASNVFSGRKYPTSNVFFPLMCDIKLSLATWMMSPLETIKSMAISMSIKFEKYWDTIHGIIGVATVLDPRYKLKLMEYFFPQLYGSAYDTHIKRIKNICYDLLNEYQKSSTRKERQYGDVSLSNISQVNEVGRRYVLARYDSFVNTIDDSLVKFELDHYLEEKILPRKEDFDILIWWDTSGIRYPTLQRIAKDILAVLVSTVTSESAFTTGGRLVSPHCSRLHPNTLEGLMCVQNWLLKDTEGICSKGNDACRATINDDSDNEKELQEDM